MVFGQEYQRVKFISENLFKTQYSFFNYLAIFFFSEQFELEDINVLFISKNLGAEF